MTIWQVLLIGLVSSISAVCVIGVLYLWGESSTLQLATIVAISVVSGTISKTGIYKMFFHPVTRSLAVFSWAGFGGLMTWIWFIYQFPPTLSTDEIGWTAVVVVAILGALGGWFVGAIYFFVLWGVIGNTISGLEQTGQYREKLRKEVEIREKNDAEWSERMATIPLAEATLHSTESSFKQKMEAAVFLSGCPGWREKPPLNSVTLVKKGELIGRGEKLPRNELEKFIKDVRG
jgi:hypothetical protein